MKLSPSGGLGTVDLGVVFAWSLYSAVLFSSLECIVETKGLIGLPGLQGVEVFRSVPRLANRPPGSFVPPDPLVLTSSGAHGAIIFIPLGLGQEARAWRLRRRWHRCPPRAPLLGCCFGALLGRGQPCLFLCTKHLRCIAFSGVKPWPGQSEISAFFFFFSGAFQHKGFKGGNC